MTIRQPAAGQADGPPGDDHHASDRPVSTKSLASLCCVQKRAAREPPFGSGWIVLRLSPYHIMSIPPIPPMPPG
ncbi:hypothetical protein GOB14_33445, partial [Sinorhizobium meliloti]|nr:hypothetical protein [Sinorhizobium meliloti]